MSLAFFVDGTCIVWPSPVLPQLQSNDTNVNPLASPITMYDISLIGCLHPIGSILAPLICGKITDIFGRKMTLLFFVVINICFLTVLTIAGDLKLIFVARFMNGFCFGGTSVILPIIVTEITTDYYRGKFCCLSSLFLPLGQLVGFITGSILPMRHFTLTCLMPLVVQLFLILLFLPETPVYLLLKGKRIAATRSLKKYRVRMSTELLEEEINMIDWTNQQTASGQKARLKSLFSQRSSRQGFVINLGVSIFAMGTGIGVIFPFMGPIFQDAQIGISGNTTAIIVCSLKIIIFVLATQFVERVGRKPLMLTSAISCSISLFCLGLYFFLKENNYKSYQKYLFLPVTSMFFYVVAYSVGVGPLSGTIITECFASDIRSIANSAIHFISKCLNSALLALFPIGLQYIGITGYVWFFSIICGLSSVFIYKMLPETKGKSIHEIQEILRE